MIIGFGLKDLWIRSKSSSHHSVEYITELQICIIISSASKTKKQQETSRSVNVRNLDHIS